MCLFGLKNDKLITVTSHVVRQEMIGGRFQAGPADTDLWLELADWAAKDIPTREATTKS